ncbi:MAG: DNA repair protein RecN, partial [Kiloniellaceae bacterium]
AEAARVAELWRAWRAAIEDRDGAARALEDARREEGFLRHALAELDALDPAPGEERALAAQRAVLMNAEKLIEAMNAALVALSGGEDAAGAEPALAHARRALERIADKAGGRFDPILATLGRAAVEVAEALAQLHSASAEIELDSGRLEEIEARYFALRELARKHGVEVDRLAELRADFAARLVAVDGGADRLARLRRAVAEARDAYVAAAESLSAARRRAAAALDRAVAAELKPLKLDKANFRTRLDRLEEPAWGAHGLDRIAFEVSTNPGSPPGPLVRIASGGELARFLLALKVVLAEVSPVRTLVFDEVDVGIGGAAAHAVGERLERLTRDRQVLVVTHSPQVGARGAHHWRVHKEPEGDRLATRVSALGPDERREEIARMLSGAEVTEEARAAARRLIEADAR